MYRFAWVLVISLLDVLKVAVFKLNNVLAEVALFNFVKGAQLSLLISPVVK